MNFTRLNILPLDYHTFLLLLLSVCISFFVVILGCYLFKLWRNKTNFVESQISDILSLLIFPSTYQDGLLKLKNVIPYKYFLSLIHELVATQRSTGVNLRASFEDLRQALQRDLQFENELRSFIKESCLQYLSYVFFSWLLCIIFLIGGLVLPFVYYWVVLLLHFVGFVVLFLFISHQQNKMGKIFDSFVPKLYRVMISCEAKLHYQKDTHFEKHLPPEILRFNHLLAKLISRRNSYGVPIAQELQLLAHDFWFSWGAIAQNSKLKIDRMKFALVMLVFGGAFMIILFGLSSILVSGVFI